MRGLFSLATATWVAALVSQVAGSTIVHPGGVDDIIITDDNILNSTTQYDFPGSDNSTKLLSERSASNPLPLSLVNNYQAGVNVYITGQDQSGRPCFLGTNGQYVYPQADNTGVPLLVTAAVAIPLGGLGSTTSFTIPGSLISARIYFAAGALKFYTVKDGNGISAIVQPAAVNPADPSAGVQWGFVEFNYDSNTLYGNISFVDFVGLPLGMGLTVGGSQQVVQGLVANSVNNICSGLNAQHNADGKQWDQLCQTSGGQALRVLSPNLFISADASRFSGYYDTYVNQVWSQYTSQDLIVNTQTDAGNVACRASGNQMTCAGDNRAYPKPTSADIFGCNSGPFAIIDSDNGVHRAVVPRLCAAFERSTLLLAGGNLQPSLPASSYYTVSPTNHYARLVHQYETNSIGYAFSYDDVNPAGANVAGELAGVNPTNLKFTVGGWS
ncbi:glycoside hydrolase family 64 protein [Xylariaceae sp. FL1272]|nr:glycoside hydrolase family 64 protein [Xylariaceae sp. FL1272]